MSSHCHVHASCAAEHGLVHDPLGSSAVKVRCSKAAAWLILLKICNVKLFGASNGTMPTEWNTGTDFMLLLLC
jgi:hypothetical protein